MIQLKIDPEFRNVIRPLSEEEFKQLEENILSDGEIYEPICVWDETIVDGHNRNMIWNAHKELPEPRIRKMNFNSKDEAIDWICKKQLGRRNLTEQEKTYTMGRMYEARKNTALFKGNQYTSGCTQSGNNQNKPHGRIGEIMANELGVGHGTVLRAADFANGIDRAEEVVPGIKEEILSGKLNTTKKKISEIRKMDSDEEVKEAIEEIRNPKPEIKKINHMSKKAKAFSQDVLNAVAEMEAEKSYDLDDAMCDLNTAEDMFFTQTRFILNERKTVIEEDERGYEPIIGFIDSVINDLILLKGEIENGRKDH